MALHLDKVLAHAERQLALKGRERPAEKLALYQKFLRIEEYRLRIKHRAGGRGREIAASRVELIDIVLRHIFAAACNACPRAGKKPATRLSVVAIGGFGRGELNPFSDVDVMFLHDANSARLPEDTDDVVQQVLYMLWDIGFKVGHSTRSLNAAIKHANEDMISKTSLLESRLVDGDKSLFAEFRKAFTRKCVLGHEDQYIAWRLESQKQNHRKYGGTVFLQEPNIKNGVGGLRDYQSLLWITSFKNEIASTSSLVENRLLLGNERKELENAYDFLLRVRTELHYQNKRATDVLTLYYQGQIANEFNYPQKTIVRRSEEFMRDYYRHARNIHRITSNVSDRLALGARETPSAPKIFNFLARRRPAREEFDGFYSEGGRLYRANKQIFDKDPHQIIRAFLHCQNRQLDLSPELRPFIQRRIRIVDRTFQYSKTARETFQTIVSRKGQVGRILRLMHEVDFLGAYIPEFGRLTCLVQHEFYHRYTADEHTLRVVEKLDELIDTTDPKLEGYRKLFEKLDKPYVLYLAILLHDTGRAVEGRHHAEASTVFAQRVARRLQLTPTERRQLLFLVDNHTHLSTTAQRRSLDDIATIEEFAGIVGNETDLDALMLLTLADGQGTTDQSTWSDWKEKLVWQLYRATLGFLRGGTAYYEERKLQREALKAEVRKKVSAQLAGEIDVHFNSMPEMYFHRFSAADIVTHIRLFQSFLTHIAGRDPIVSLAPVFKWSAHPDQGHSEALICTWDREGLLERIAGAFAVAGLNILSADIYTRSDNLVLDVFRICDTNFNAVTHPHDIELVEKTLASSLIRADFDFSPLIAASRQKSSYALSSEIDFPTRITISNEAHPVYTVVDIQAPDRLGLLYDILRGFSRAGANIALSRIATEKGGVIDSFYITDRQGQKIQTEEGFRTLQESLREATTSATFRT